MLYRDMTLGRRFEDNRAPEMYLQGKMFGFVHFITARKPSATG